MIIHDSSLLFTKSKVHYRLIFFSKSPVLANKSCSRSDFDVSVSWMRA